MTKSEDDNLGSNNFNLEHFTKTFAYLPVVTLNHIEHLEKSLKLAASKHLIVCTV